ncbi:MotB Flagellar motor protein [Oxalobacteraceae bacterium]|jgi:chemotaxis protein MotB
MAEEEKKPEDEAAAAAAEGEAAPDAPPAEPAEEPKPPVIWKKIEEEGHAGAHGGAWKIALADMMTAMMAFFLLMWLLGATPEEQRIGIAEYFQPTELKVSGAGETAGSNGMFGGRSIIDPETLPMDPKQQALIERVTPRAEGGKGEDAGTSPDDKPNPKYGKNLSEEEKQKIAEQAEREKLDKLEQEITENLSLSRTLADLKNQVQFTREKTGLRIDIIDKANFSMFGSGNAAMDPRARALINEVTRSLANMPNKLAVKGHTDSSPFPEGSERTNWSLSIERAEATRRMLETGGIGGGRIVRIEGVADTAPFNPQNPADPRNRRISITVLYNDPPLEK